MPACAGACRAVERSLVGGFGSRSRLTTKHVERFHRSLEHKHLYQNRITIAAERTEEITAHPALCNEIRAHEALELEQPLVVHLAAPQPIRG